MQVFNPEVKPGIRESDFQKICQNGFGDGYNAYAYSSAWYKDHLYIGTGRANLCLLKFAMPFIKMDVWPVECAHRNYTPEFETTAAQGEIWRYSPDTTPWERVYQAPLVEDPEEGIFYSRDLGYRSMVVFQGDSDPEPALYVAAWGRSRSTGLEILRTVDGIHFEPTPKPRFQSIGGDLLPITAIRVFVPFKGKLYTAPTGTSRSSVNAALNSLIYETSDPASGEWRSVNDPGFGPPIDLKTVQAGKIEVAVVYDMAAFGDYLYAGTAGDYGFQIWRSRCEGSPPYEWECIMTGGAGRGGLNQGTVSMQVFNNALYIGTGIQNGGYDARAKLGPAAAEIIRIHPDNSWDIVVGNPRDGKKPISGLSAGFGNYFCGYIWRMAVHDGWLYAGTMDWTVILSFTNLAEKPMRISKLMAAAGIQDYLEVQGGFDLWRTQDGENWVHVTRNGFHNPYNYGCRGIISTPKGLFIASANPFGPKVATRKNPKAWEWTYEDNPAGGLEVWYAPQKV